jgi:hypothetical protein
MRTFSSCLLFRATAFFLLALFSATVLAAPVAAQQATPAPAQPGSGNCMEGTADGERDAKGNPLWVLAGAGCGIFGAGAAYLYKPAPPVGKLMGKSSEYALCYTEKYQSKSRNQNTAWACGGWLAFIVVYIAAGGLDTSDTNSSSI